MRRIALLLAALAVIGTNWSATPQAQRRGPTLSADLLAPRAPGQRIRVIVQGEEPVLRGLRGRLGAWLRREVEGGVALELTQQQFEAMSKEAAGLASRLPEVA